MNTQQKAVKEVIDAFYEARKTKDLDRLSTIIAHDADCIHFGTDADERWVGWENLKKDTLAQFKAQKNLKVSYRDLRIHISDAGDTAWFSQIVDLEGKSKGGMFDLTGARFTGVLIRRDEKWLFVQTHLSLPVEGQAAAY